MIIDAWLSEGRLKAKLPLTEVRIVLIRELQSKRLKISLLRAKGYVTALLLNILAKCCICCNYRSYFNAKKSPC